MLSALKLVIGLLICFGLFFLTPQAYAQTATTSTTPVIRPLGPVTPASPHFVNLQVINFMHSISCLVAGFSPINQPCITYLSEQTQSGINTIPVLSSVDSSGGVLGVAANGLSFLYTNPPLRSVDYLGGVWDRLDLFNVREAHAQVGGSGSGVLSPILTLWQVSRNIAYIVMIIIFVVIGVMVMLRNRINPQTVVSVQAALPGLVIGLVLITFSYFLASLLTDVAFVGSNIVGHYFTIAQGQPVTPLGGVPNNPVQTLANENVLSIMSRFLTIPHTGDFIAIFRNIFNNLPPDTSLILDPLSLNPTRLFKFLIIGLITQITNLTMPGAAATAASAYAAQQTLANDEAAVGSFFVFLVLVLVLMYSMFKILYRLIINYLTIIFLTFSAPFTFLIASFPGRQGDVTNWMRSMLANIIAFPAVLAMFYFAAYLMGPAFLRGLRTTTGISCSPLFPPPPTPTTLLPLDCLFNINQQLSISGGGALPLLGGFDQTTLQFILAYGALIAAPAIPDVIINTIGKPSAAGQAVGREVTGAITSGRQYLERGAGAIGGAFRGGQRR